MPEEIDNLRSRWESLLRPLGTPATRHWEFEQLVGHYREPHRGYHNLCHIADCLQHFDAVRHLVPDPNAIETAIWFHDVIYDPRGRDNEGASARYAEVALSRLAADPMLRREVGRLIELTRHDEPPVDLAGQLIIDVDLASLGAPAAAFDENGRNIRREYAHVDDDAYRQARVDVLRRFVARSRIYHTDVFFDRFEDAARANLRRAITALEG